MYTGSGNYQQDYDRMCKLDADIEVWQKKVTDYTRIKTGLQNDFDTTVKKLAQLEIELDELSRNTWTKLKSKVTGKYETAYHSATLSRESTQRQLDEIKYKLQDTKGRLKDAAENLEKAKAEKNALRDYMKRNYTQFAEYERKQEAEKQRLRTIIKEIEEAEVVVREVINIAKLSIDKFKSAKNWGMADIFFDDGIFTEVMKYNKINSAQSMVHTLNATIARMNKELRDVNDIYGVYCQEFGSDIKFMDFFFDNIFVDWSVVNKIESNINSLNSLVIKLTDVLNILKNNKSQVQKEIDSL